MCVCVCLFQNNVSSFCSDFIKFYWDIIDVPYNSVILMHSQGCPSDTINRRTFYGVAQSRTGLKWLSSSSSKGTLCLLGRDSAPPRPLCCRCDLFCAWGPPVRGGGARRPCLAHCSWGHPSVRCSLQPPDDTCRRGKCIFWLFISAAPGAPPSSDPPDPSRPGAGILLVPAPGWGPALGSQRVGRLQTRLQPGSAGAPGGQSCPPGCHRSL